jgi:hypothetical protein
MFDNLLILQMHPSKRLFMVLSVLHVAAWVTLWLPLQLPDFVAVWVVRLTLNLLILMSYYHTLRYHVWLLDNPLKNCALYNDHVWLGDGQIATIASDSYQSQWLVVLRVRLSSGRKHTLVIFPDAMEVNLFRQLRVRLRHRFE